MKQLKKMLSFFLAVMLLFSSVPADVSAANTDSDTVIRVESENVTKGENVSVDILIENNPGILGATLEISFDEGLTLLDATSGDAFSYLSMTKPGRLESTCKFTWDGVDFAEEDIKDGTILTLTFSMKDDVEMNVPLAVNVSAPEGDIYDADLNYIDVKTVSGSVTVLEFMLGDLNDDRRVNVQDIILLRRYLVGGYDVEINTKAANVNGDSKITSADVILIRRYLAGGYGVELVPSPDLCNHTMQETKAQTATCTEEGNIAFWHCTSCKRYYTDVYGNQETTLDNTVIEALGHNSDGVLEAVPPSGDKPGLTEGRYCTKCNEVMDPQEEWMSGYYTITYDVSNGDDYLATLEIINENKTLIAEGTTVYLEDLSVKGYRFLGWYDKAGDGNGNNATLVQKIQNIDHNITLYAHWEAVAYDIQYKSDLVSVSSDSDTTYTVNKGKILPTLKLDGYTFAGWTDFEGNKYSRIKAGTTGDVVLYANWLSDRNQAWAKKELDDPIVYEDDENGVILFTYEIGEIRNVPVYEIVNFGKINGSGITKEFKDTISVTTTESLMEACSNTVAKATTDSSSWTLSKDWTDSVSVSEEYCEENGLSKTEATNISQSETGNWYVSNSKGGSHTTTEIDSTDTYDLQTSNNNTRSWSKDYAETVQQGKETLTYNTTDRTHGYEVNAGLSLSKETSGGAEVGGEAGGEAAGGKVSGKLSLGEKIGKIFNIGGSYEDKDTDKSGTEETTKEADVTTMKGSVTDSATGGQTGTVTNHTSNTTNTATWNSEIGYSKSSAVSKDETLSATLSQLISSKTGYGQSYISEEGESTTQDTTQTESEAQEYSSQVTFSTVKESSKEMSFTTTSAVSGFHRWVMAGTAHVFAVVGYDIATQNYFVYNLSIMDDELYQYEDYSYNSSTYDDNQCSIIPFEVPHDIADYVNAMLFATDGLEVDVDGTNGTITAYHGTDSAVVIPDYARIDNKDGTYSVVKVTGLSADAFSGNENITGVRLSKYIETIPKEAFKGCTKLWDIVSSAKSIGTSAFEGCPLLVDWSLSSKIENLEPGAFNGATYLTVNAANLKVVESALQSGAENIVIGISDMKGTLDGVTLNVSDKIKQFIFKGYGKTFNNLTINSNAESTILNRININSDDSLPLQISSPDVGLYQMTVNAQGIPALLSADSTKVDLYGQVNLNTEAENSLFCKNADYVQTTTGLTTKLNGNGDLVTCGNVTGTNYLNFKQIRTVDEDMFNKMLHSYTLTFDANGGKCDITSMEVKNATAIGTLPVPARDGFDFAGWYLANGTQVTATTVFNTGEDQTVRARWNAKEYKVTWDEVTGKSITVKRTSSPYKNATTGTLLNGDKIYYGDVLQVSYSTYDAWTVDSHGKENITVSGNVTSKDIYMTVWTDWKDWSTTSVSQSDTVAVETKKQYRYSDKLTTSSTNSSLSGWTQTGSNTSYGAWGGWSAWQVDPVGSSDTQEVETATVYGWYYYLCPSCGAHMHVYTSCYTWAGGCGRSTMNSGSWAMMWTTTHWNNAGIYEFHGTGRYATDSLGGGRWFKWIDAANQRTGYRYRTRSKTIIYSYEKWNDWSGWSDTSYSTSATRQVETRTLYRYKTKL